MDCLRSLKGRADLSQLPRNLDQVLVKNKGRKCLSVQISCCITQKNFYVKVGAVNLLLRTLGTELSAKTLFARASTKQDNDFPDNDHDFPHHEKRITKWYQHFLTFCGKSFYQIWSICANFELCLPNWKSNYSIIRVTLNTEFDTLWFCPVFAKTIDLIPTPCILAETSVLGG